MSDDSDLGQFGPNSDLSYGRFGPWALTNSDLLKTRSELAKVRMKIRSELAKVRIELRAESTKVQIAFS